MVLTQEPEIVQNGLLAVPKTRYIQSRPKNASRAMKIRRSGNGFAHEPEMHENGHLVAPKIRYSVQTEKWVARHENKQFWQWF